MPNTATPTIVRVDAHGVPKTMRWWNYLADGSGMVTAQMIGGMTALITYFYTDKVGMAAGAAASALFLAKLLDGIADLVVGPLVDRTRSRWGKARPWFLFMAVPAAVAVPLLYGMPDNLSGSGQFWYALLTNIFATGVAYSALMIPYGVLMVYASRSSAERTNMAVIRAVFSFIFGAILAVGGVPIANALGGTKQSWALLALITGIVAGIAALIVFFGTREHYTDEGAEKKASDVPYLAGLGFLFRNRYWVTLLIFNLLASVYYALSGVTGVYYAKWILGDENLVAILGAAGFLPLLLGFAVIGPISKRVGLTRTMWVGLLLMTVVAIVRTIFPYSFPVAVVGGLIGGLGLVPLMVNVGVLSSFVAEYNELTFGNNLAGLNGSATSFGGKVASGIGGSLTGWLLGWGAYNASLTTQPASAIQAILAVSIWIPGLLTLGMMLLLTRFDLEKRYPQIVAELAEKRAAATGMVAATAGPALVDPVMPDPTVGPAESDLTDGQEQR